MRKKRKQAETAAPHLETKRISPVDIQQKEFRLAMRGYNERDVDQFLDEVTEEVARLYADNKRLREEVEFGKTTRLETTGAGEADGIIRQAREEAARIIAEATARASTIGAADPVGHAGGGPDSAAGAPPNEIMGIFLARERAFLQNMANLIQAHAEGVKQDVRRVREQVTRQVPAAESPAAQPGAVESGAGAEASTEPPAEAEEPEEGAYAQAVTDEPTQAWEAVPGIEHPETGPSRHDLVDLTQEGEGPTEHTAERVGKDSGQSSEAGAALSSVYGRPQPSKDAGESFRQPREPKADASPGPGVEDDDAREDRSIRELFWGED